MYSVETMIIIDFVIIGIMFFGTFIYKVLKLPNEI